MSVDSNTKIYQFFGLVVEEWGMVLRIVLVLLLRKKRRLIASSNF